MTLACGDGTFLAFATFRLYIRGTTGDELSAILDFLYYVEVNLRQDNLDGFLALAEDLKVKGLPGTSDDDRLTTQIQKKASSSKDEEKLDFNRRSNKNGDLGAVMKDSFKEEQLALNRQIKLNEFHFLHDRDHHCFLL